MPQSYKQQVSDLRDCLALSNAELSVSRTELRNAKTAVSSVYRAMSAAWMQLSKIETLNKHITGEVGFLDQPTLTGQNLEVMTDHILSGLQHIALGAGEAGLELRGIKHELTLSDDVVQTHRDAVDTYSLADLKSPLDHFTNALDLLEKEDQQLRVQIAYSENKRYESFKTTVELLEEKGNVKSSSVEAELLHTDTPPKKDSTTSRQVADQEDERATIIAPEAPSKERKKPAGFSRPKTQRTK